MNSISIRRLLEMIEYKEYDTLVYLMDEHGERILNKQIVKSYEDGTFVFEDSETGEQEEVQEIMLKDGEITVDFEE